MSNVRLVIIALPLLLAGCSSTAYYAQAIGGQFELWRASRPLAEAETDKSLPDATRQQLARAKRIRDFASRDLLLPDNGSYRRYADLKRPYVVWNVFAADPLSLEAKQWCFAVAGCVGYRGYFSEADARAFAAELHSAGDDVDVGGVAAYSTLGWFDDPILNTFIHYPDTELARLIFHELAHQVLYVRDDTEFNESFAATVEEAGVGRWLAASGTVPEQEAFLKTQARRADFYDLIKRCRERLRAVYAGQTSNTDKLAAKSLVLAELQREYHTLRDGKWGGYSGYDGWFAQDVNNATLVSIGLYRGLVPAFQALLADNGEDLGRFYVAVKTLAALPREQRRAKLLATK